MQKRDWVKRSRYALLRDLNCNYLLVRHDPLVICIFYLIKGLLLKLISSRICNIQSYYNP
jgi:hypothetical protein